MTVAELRSCLRDLNDDAEVLVLDGDHRFAFGPPAVRMEGDAAVIDLTAESVESADDYDGQFDAGFDDLDGPDRVDEFDDFARDPRR